MMTYSPDDSARERAIDLIREAQRRTRQQAWSIKKEYRVEFRPLERPRKEMREPRRSVA